jgi:flagellar capping protein FliD
MGRPKFIGPLTASETKKKQQRHAWYQRNKELTKQRSADSKIRTQKWFKQEKSKHQCFNCSNTEFNQLGFYDLTLIYGPSLTKPEKINQVSEMVGRKSRVTIKKEIETRTCLCNHCWHTHYRHY